MYFVGVIADPAQMTEVDFECWINAAYFYMIADFVVAVTLAETDIAQQVADKCIASGEELCVSGMELLLLAAGQSQRKRVGSRQTGRFIATSVANHPRCIGTC